MITTATKKDVELISHLLRRAGFGAPYGELERYAAKGYQATVEELLDPEAQPQLEEDVMLRMNIGWQHGGTHPQDISQWVHRMINTRRPLEEKITLFWHGILCTGYAKVDYARTMTDTVRMFRKYGLGTFRDLLVQLALDPGMIYYLDNCISHRGAINENWGRELLELFSMGVGNYTEDDVKETARAFTGWTVAPTFPPYPYTRINWEFLYDTTDHDEGEKQFLGRHGKFNGEDIIDIICGQPTTACFLARQMYAFFVADEAPVPQWATTPARDPQAIETLIKAYFESGNDIRGMLRVLFNSEFFKNARFARVKSPTEVVISTVRLARDFTAPRPGFIEVVRACQYMGQELLNPPTVEGWHTGKEWIDSGTLVERLNFVADQLGDLSKPGVREITERLSASQKSLTPEAFVEGCLEQLGGVAVSLETRHSLVEHAKKGGPVATGTEEFGRRTANMLRLIASCKEYHFG